MSLVVDAEVRERIRSGKLDANLCVEAGAGTGKTTVLVDRVVALLVTGRATVDQLAVITFTEKAAGELSARVRFALESAATASALDSVQRARAARAVGELYRARIQTIHAFASDLLRERPVEARLDPQFETMDDVSAEVHFEQSYRRWLDGQLAERNEAIEKALRRGFELRQLRDVVEAVHRHREVLPLAPVAWDPPALGVFRLAAADWVPRLNGLEGSCADADDGAFVQLGPVREFCVKVLDAMDDAEVERLVLFEAPRVDTRGGRAGSWEGDACARVKEVLKTFLGAVDELAPALRTDALTGLLPLAEDFALRYGRRRRGDGLADFDDLLIWARDLVREDRHVRAHFHRRTTHVLVDEFQDTDPVQAELIVWLCAASDEAATDWRAVKPVPGSLFVVGDPKQSIYRFRGADVAVYDAVKGGPMDGKVELLSQNFRSSQEVLGWLNGVFNRVLASMPGVQPGNAELVGRWSMASELERPPVVVVRAPDVAADAGELRAVESSLLARVLVRAVGDETWRVRDRHAGEAVRPARWGDVAVLVPSRTGIERLEAALQQYGVPYRFEGGRGFFSRQEVRDLVSLLHAVDDPTDAISLVAALRSLAFGCSDEDLLLWQLEHGRFDYRLPNGAGPPAVQEAMAMLADLHRAARGLSLAELVREAVERTGLVEAALSLPSGRQSAANVMKLLDHAREFSAAGNGALRAFTGWLARMRDREVDEIDAPVAEERDDTVRVMTIHAAKGLEFPIVCLANLSATGSTQMAPVADAGARSVELTLGSVSRKTNFCTPGWEGVKTREKQALAAERDRLLYVACTRARDHLVVPVCVDSRGPKGFMERLAESLDEGCWEYDVGLLEAVEPVPETVESGADEAPVLSAADARDAWVTDRDSMLRDASAGVELITASSVKVDPRPLAAVTVSTGAGNGRDADDEATTIDVESTPPLELGDAFHRVMERVSLPGGEDLEALAEAICAEAGLPHEVGLVMEMGRRCLESEVVRRAVASGTVQREVPFVVEEEDGRVLVGRMDFVFREGERVVVVDYKTDRVALGDEDAALEAHRGQTGAYRRAVQAALGAPEHEVRLLFARTGAAVAVSEG